MDYESDIGYSPPVSLWHLVEQHVPASEQDEIKSMLGSSSVDETLELHEELCAYLEIWRECKKETDSKMQIVNKSRLPEPPGMRERLIQEIKFFVDNVKEKAQDLAIREADVLKHYNQKVIDYAMNGSDSRPVSCDLLVRTPSVVGRDGRETPSLRMGSPASDRMSASTYSTISEEVESMSDKLNILKLDEVILHLRSYLAEEKEWLVQDLRFLQQCIDEENVSSSSVQDHIPTIAELREERHKLEKEMLSDLFKHQAHPGVTSNASLKPASARTMKTVVPKSGPIKAVHNTPPDGVVLTGNVPQSIIIKAQQRLLDESHQYKSAENSTNVNSTLVKLGSLPTHQLPFVINDCYAKESMTVSNLNRPSSALRFRSMVMNSRDKGNES